MSRDDYCWGVSTAQAPTLAEDKRQATVERILRAARYLIGARGLDMTMDEIAVAAGVGRRTVFRHFESRENLLAAAVESGMRRYGERLPAYDGGDWRAWLKHLCLEVHRMNGSYGPGYWELTTRRDLPGELAAMEERRRRARRAAMNRVSADLWKAAGGKGPTPAEVAGSVGAHLSVHFTAAVTADAGQDWQRAASLAFASIAASLDSGLAASRGHSSSTSRGEPS